MKRSVTLLLLALFLLNVLGYYGIFMGLQLKNGLDMRASFDNEDYSRNQEVTIKMPLAVPYSTSSEEYVRVDGEFEHKGQTYRMVKQRLHQDTLYIVCVKDDASQEMKQALADYVKSFSDKPSSEKGQSKTTQNFIKDYIPTFTAIQSVESGWNKSFTYGNQDVAYESLESSHTSPPPRG